MVHNKTLAGQLYSELKEFFPNNRVEYFISNFDYYQPEAYMPKSDTYIDKSSLTNLELDMMRSSAINSLLEREDTIVVASVAAIYGAIDPDEYRHMSFNIKVDEDTNRNELIKKLIDAQFKRNDIDLAPGSFRVRGDCIEIAPSSTNEFYIRIDMFGDEKLRGGAVVATLAHQLTIHHNTPLGTTALGVEEDISVAPQQWELHLVGADHFACLIGGGGGEFVDQIEVVALGRAVALLGCVACGVGDILGAPWGYTLPSYVVEALRPAVESGSYCEECGE
jgi:hypothetical protein